MEKAYFNCSNKVWIFWTNDINITILQDKEQHVHIKAEHNNCPSFLLMIVYAKCTEELRRELWSDSKNLASTIKEPWGVIGDFNVITNREEKLGGRPHRLEKSLEFIECLNEYGLQDAGFAGAKVTCCDNRDPPLTIWKRLDKLVYNLDWFDNLNNTPVTHISRSCSDHVPLLVKLHHEYTQGTRYFKFLNLWTEHPEFKQTVQNSWNIFIHGNPLYILHQKIKNTTKALSTWSRATFGDIYEEPKRLKNFIRDLEEICMTNNTLENRSELSKSKVEFIRYLKIHDSILSQKARINWFNKGDANTAYFYATIKKKRRKLTIRRIQDGEGNWLEDCESIVEGDEDNIRISAIPTLQEVTKIVFPLMPIAPQDLMALVGCSTANVGAL
ncbi:uncharacterized protein LOC142178801 [Nicotiana tabacum]|uniref:Uncharacterized protein LOC142178801 n=1 Tax=Nicotiana tabacum TaxID=4097 RepID=A0AC58U562_TOBAC